MKRTMIALLIALLAGAAPAAWADCNLPAEIDRASELIQRARSAVERSSPPEARDLLRSAIARREEAVELGRRDRRDAACRAARVAQGFAQKAVEVARSGVRGLDELEDALRRTDGMIRSAGNVVERSDSRDAARRLSTARKQQNEAWSAFRDRNPRFAMKLTMTARETVNQAVRLAEGSGRRRPRPERGP